MQGYQVLEASNGVEALEVAGDGETIDLLFTDMVMPLMSGRKLAEEFRQLQSETKVIYASGYTADSQFLDEVLEEGGVFLQKPITPEELTLKVREVLDKRIP